TPTHPKLLRTPPGHRPGNVASADPDPARTLARGRPARGRVLLRDGRYQLPPGARAAPTGSYGSVAPEPGRQEPGSCAVGAVGPVGRGVAHAGLGPALLRLLPSWTPSTGRGSVAGHHPHRVRTSCGHLRL